MAWIYFIVWPFVSSFFKTIFRCWRIKNKKRMKMKGAIYASNHNSNAEGAILNSYSYRPVRFFGKSELFEKPINRFIMKGVGTIPIKRGGSDKVAFKNAIEALKKGKRVGIFPEGTRGDGTELLDPHTGVIRLALLSGAPIIPVGISGGTRAWPKGGGPKFFKKVEVNIGEPWTVPQPSEGRELEYYEMKELARYLMFELIEPLLNKELDART